MPSSFLELLEKRADTLDRVYATSLRQGELVQSGDMSGLLEVLGAKQRMLDELEQIERKLDPYRDTPPEKRQWSSEEERQKAERLIRRCEIRLHEIIEKDHESEAVMLERRSDIQKELQTLGNQRASHEYARQAAAGRSQESPPSRLDLQSGK